jgi:hypothetical protein
MEIKRRRVLVADLDPCLDGDQKALGVWSSFWRILQRAAVQDHAEFVLMDVGPNLGSMNRAALAAADYFVVPVAPDVLSTRALMTLGPAIGKWRREWKSFLDRDRDGTMDVPRGRFQPAGYVLIQAAGPFERWTQRIPEIYSREVLGDNDLSGPLSLGRVKQYHSLTPMAQEARKPIFHLTAADGAIGAHVKAVIDARANFADLAVQLLRRCNIPQRATSSL